MANTKIVRAMSLFMGCQSAETINHSINKRDIKLTLSFTLPKAFNLRTWLAMQFISLAGMVAPFNIKMAIKAEGE